MLFAGLFKSKQPNYSKLSIFKQKTNSYMFKCLFFKLLDFSRNQKKHFSDLNYLQFLLYLQNAVDLGQFEGAVGKLRVSGTFSNIFHHLASRNDKVMTFQKNIL